MNMKKLFAGVMAFSVMAGAMQCFGTTAVDFDMSGISGGIADYSDKSATYTEIQDYTSIVSTSSGDVVLNSVLIKSDDSNLNNTLAIKSMKSKPEGKIDLVISSEGSNLKKSMILHKAFYGEKDIKSLELGEGISHIYQLAFADCDDIETIKLPSTIKNLGTAPFASINNLKSITVADGGILRTDKGALRDGSSLFVYPPKKTDLTSYTVSSGIKEIRHYCFAQNTTLKSITLPESVERIYPYAFYGTRNCTITIMNKNCAFYDDGFFKSTNFIDSTATICGYKGSTAETYAKENNIKFVDIEATTTTKAVTTAKTTTKTTVATTVKTTAKTTAKATVPVTTAVSSGKTLLGDANEDGKVNVADAAAIIQHIGNQDDFGLSAQGLANAELCDGKKGIMGSDAIAIQKLVADMIESLPDNE